MLLLSLHPSLFDAEIYRVNPGTHWILGAHAGMCEKGEGRKTQIRV
jgi:hypothetical protein